MKKSILNIGKALNKAEQKEIRGNGPIPISAKCYPSDCDYISGIPEHCKIYC